MLTWITTYDMTGTVNYPWSITVVNEAVPKEGIRTIQSHTPLTVISRSHIHPHTSFKFHPFAQDPRHHYRLIHSLPRQPHQHKKNKNEKRGECGRGGKGRGKHERRKDLRSKKVVRRSRRRSGDKGVRRRRVEWKEDETKDPSRRKVRLRLIVRSVSQDIEGLFPPRVMNDDKYSANIITIILKIITSTPQIIINRTYRITYCKL